MSHEATRKLTDSALLMAVSMVLFLGAFVPLLGILVAPFSPLPLCMLAMRYGPRHGALVGLTAIGALSLIFSPVYGVAFLPFVYVGLVLGIMGHLQSTGGRIWVVGTFSTLALLWALFAGYDAYATATGRMATFEQLSGRMFDRARATTERVGGLMFRPDAELLRASLVNLERFRGVTRGALAVPLLPLLSLAVMGFSLSYLVAWLLLPKVGFKLQGLPPFSQWRTPWPLAWGFIASCLAYEWGGEGLTHLWVVSVFDAFVAVYVVMGISVLEHYLAGLAVPWPLRCVVYGAALVWLTFPPVPALTLLGVLDPFVDFRRFRGSAPGAASVSTRE